MRTRVAFYLPEPPRIDIDTIDIEHDWHRFVWPGGDWILQTFLRLRSAGVPVTLIDAPPASGIVVTHARRLDELLRGLGDARPFGVVSVRAEVLPPRRDADWEIVQNAGAANNRRSFFVPMWPQPGLVPRSTHRGSRIERVGYKGFEHNLHPYFTSEAWRSELAARGIEWVCELWDDDDPPPWHDFSSLDLVVAVRPDLRRRYRNKPASKLVNAWLAGVPAIVGPEAPFRELRESADDFVEVRAPEQALDAIDTLRRNPARYLAMIENGTDRGAQFSPEAIAAQWIGVLGELSWQEPGQFELLRRRTHRASRHMRLAAYKSRTHLNRWRTAP
jgi:hypothetical protein